MSSPRYERLLWFALAIAALGVVSCGGKASSEARNVSAGGASGAYSVGGAAGAEAPDGNEVEPSVVRVSGNDGDVDPRATPECLAGFHGFAARVGGLSVDFKAFVAEPGDYEGDSVQILWLEARRANGEHYLAAAGTPAASGSISLHVAQIEPRFIGNLDASLLVMDGPMRAPLMLSLTFDIAVRAGCP